MVISEEAAEEFLDLHLLTDCKSLYDHLHREGTPKAPSDKRLAVDLASLRQTLVCDCRAQWRKLFSAPTAERLCRLLSSWLTF